MEKENGMSKLQRGMVLAAILAAGVVGGCFPIELSVSPDGAVVVPRAEGFCLYDSAKGTSKVLYAPKDAKPVFAQFSPDGKQVLAISAGGDGGGFVAAIVPAAGGEPKKVYEASNLAYAQWSPDGKTIAFTRIADEKVAPVDDSLPELVLVNPADGTSKKVFSNTSVIQRWFGDSKSLLAIQVTGKEQSNGRYLGKLVRVSVPGGEVKPLAALVSDKSMFFSLAPDGTKALFTAIKAGKVDEKLDPNSEGESQLFELTVASGAVRAVKPKSIYGIYSPKGTKVLVGSAGEGDTGLKLEVFDAGMTKGTVVANDAAKSAGDGPSSADIYPGWLDDNNALYIRLHAVYGTEGKNLELISVDPQGKGVKNHQPVIESGLQK
jgi:dipeptidyl aminopeptidase/acylaminoacyl peptidase